MKKIYILSIFIYSLISIDSFGQEPARYYFGDYNGALVKLEVTARGHYTYDGIGQTYPTHDASILSGTPSTEIPVVNPYCHVSTLNWKASLYPAPDRWYRLKLFKTPLVNYNGIASDQNTGYTFVGQSSLTTNSNSLLISNVVIDYGYIYVGVIMSRKKRTSESVYKFTNTVFVSRTCNPACLPSHVIHTNYGSGANEIYEASNTITADNVLSSGSTLIYDAGTSISLVEGFHAQMDSDFRAYIDGCTPVSNRPAKPFNTAGDEERSQNGDEERSQNSDVKNEPLSNDLYSIYPSPATNFLNVTLKDGGSLDDVIISVYDLQARQIENVKLSVQSNEHLKLDVSQLTAGSYILQIQSTNTVYTEKWIKK